jgi:hypothetical protein
VPYWDLYGTHDKWEPPKAFRRCSSSVGGASRMSRSEQYRRFARECMEMACVFGSERNRAALIHMAQVWLRLAEEQKLNDEESDDES